MDEMYRMLGREHEVDLEREARKWHQAAELRSDGSGGRLGSERKLVRTLKLAWSPRLRRLSVVPRVLLNRFVGS
jgi:hypothetical protein